MRPQSIGIRPDSILRRQKTAFSDAAGRFKEDDLKEYAGTHYSSAPVRSQTLNS